MKQKITIILLIIAVAGIAYFLIRPTVEPKFHIEWSDNLKKEGVFYFGGNENYFSKDKAGIASSRNNYFLKFGMDKNNRYTFDLYKDGIFVKNLKTLW